jgi:hypothetical protein
MSAQEAKQGIASAIPDDVAQKAANSQNPEEQPSSDKLRRMSVSQQNDNLLKAQREQFK